MNLSKILKNAFLIVIFGLIVTACATKKSVKTTRKVELEGVQNNSKKEGKFQKK